MIMIMISFFLGKRNKKRERKKKKMIFSRGIKKRKVAPKEKVSISIKFPFFLDFTSKMLYLCSVFSS